MFFPASKNIAFRTTVTPTASILLADPIPDRPTFARDAHKAVARRAGHNIRAFLAFMHDAIVAAKMRRIQRELMCHSRAEQDAGGFPRRPLILGDKWDF